MTINLPGDQRFDAILSTGHADIGVAYEDDAWDLHIHDEENDAEYEPGDALLHVGSQALITRDGGLAGPAFDFLGVAAGGSFYRLPQSENPELLFLGFGAEEIESRGWQIVGDNYSHRTADYTCGLATHRRPVQGQECVGTDVAPVTVAQRWCKPLNLSGSRGQRPGWPQLFNRVSTKTVENSEDRSRDTALMTRRFGVMRTQ